MKIIFLILLLILGACTLKEDREDREDRKDTSKGSTELVLHSSGLVEDDNLPVILAHCTGCHSGQLVAQNRASREGWKAMITWMQKSQNLADLGNNEEVILDYLEKYYGPEESGRRKSLVITEWYKLD